MDFVAIKNNEVADKWRVMSIGGGAIRIEGKPYMDSPDFYKEKNFTEIKKYCEKHHLKLYEYVEQCEGPEIYNYLEDVWHHMKLSIKEGLSATGILHGGLKLQRKARYLYRQRHMDESPSTRENRIVCSYAFAASEQNAGGGIVVTAPTCGSCGVLPAVLKYMQEKNGYSNRDILRALAAAGVIGNVIKTNASISGAECGCQAEIGTACSMASAGLAELFGMDLDQIEYAAEVAMEHHLGLTCDPIMGLVQIPCIERNAVAAMRAINSVSLANFLTHTRKISFDMVVDTMYETGRDLFSKYRETSEGGLAIKYSEKKGNKLYTT
jgi:L-serine dehydratase